MGTALRTSLLALAATVALGIPATASAANSLGPNMFGISVGGDIQNEDPATMGRDLDVLETAGARWLRIDINWAQIQAGGASSYKWDAIDRVVQGANAHGMQVLGIIAYTPSWARPSDTSSRYAPDPAKYAAFARTAAQHYSAMGVHAYEIWNEPNNASFWNPKPDPRAYTKLLKAAYPAVKEVDPQATILAGATSPAATNGTNISPVDFLKGIYANGGGDSFDAVSHHPYSWPAAPGDAESWSPWHQMYGTSPSLRSVMIANGDGGKKIWATEFGAPTDGPSGSHVSEATQAQMISKAYSLWESYDWGGPLFAYEGRDLGTSTSTRENFFGMLRHDFSEKPAFDAYRIAAEAADGDTGGDTGDVPTTIVVKGKGKGKGPGRVRGRVSTIAEPPAAEAASTEPPATEGTEEPTDDPAEPLMATGRVQLRLRKRDNGRWHNVGRIRNSRLTVNGRFYQRLRSFRHRRLRSGRYRVRVHYPGSEEVAPATTLSRVFKYRH